MKRKQTRGLESRRFKSGMKNIGLVPCTGFSSERISWLSANKVAIAPPTPSAGQRLRAK